MDYASLKQAARTLLEEEGIKSAKITIAIVTDEHIHRLNRQFLQHDEPTDVLTFPYSKGTTPHLEGEIVISYETAQHEAAERGHATATEVILYVIHGCLHLCGYDDTSPEAATAMRQRERHYLLRLGYPDITHPTANAIEQASPSTS
ncbi:MAG: rRNA maturation RNase YbeY [Gemmataceae bacterium]|nr:rRNA maturation RNase YbeY [Gemmataceae bacterium]MDW8241850.1 rRNA maturation RNase YbeY [Thermogemmata sp.]